VLGCKRKPGAEAPSSLLSVFPGLKAGASTVASLREARFAPPQASVFALPQASVIALPQASVIALPQASVFAALVAVGEVVEAGAAANPG
jgi:hypothetical protein